ncbi:hypothetical protein RchiOBHm_Chr5g0058591 [Rosa chinensis]|uniref:Uncharacterized protein n=1 Tax=Rosa chinensis TaxID=74649 RepID=A0A2P6QH71_ROSCH|nr:hypothetical protein RchiOBHm_Chr5g0058591 [Rosa chinensis]
MDFVVLSINTKFQYFSSHQSKDFERGKVCQSSSLCAFKQCQRCDLVQALGESIQSY